jgi:hypothetical protein
MLPGNNQYMRWRLWIDIAKSQYIIVLKNDVSRDFPIQYLTKKTITHKIYLNADN